MAPIWLGSILGLCERSEDMHDLFENKCHIAPSFMANGLEAKLRHLLCDLNLATSLENIMTATHNIIKFYTPLNGYLLSRNTLIQEIH